MISFLRNTGLSVIICLLAVCAYAEDIDILFTGETHAMLYPCNCPFEPDGGVARRATLIKELRKNNPNTLFLDSGGFFAGGLMDEYTQNTQLDMQRTIVNLKAMELMGYDAATIGDDAFNFGKQFMEENIAKTKITFLSSNIEADRNNSFIVLPYTIKEIAGIKIGIIGATNLLARQKVSDLNITDPKSRVKRAVEELKTKQVNIIVLLSHLGEEDDLRLIKDIKGIDIVIIGHSRSKDEPTTKVGSTVIVRPSWQGKRLGKLSLTINNGKITDYKVEKLRLSDKIKDDPEILSILPRCFSDTNCKKDYVIGSCQNSGTLNSACVFPKAVKVLLTIIVPRECLICQTQDVVGSLKKQFPGLAPSYLEYPGAKASKLIRDLGISTLPAYILEKDVEKEKGFDSLRNNLQAEGDFYVLNPDFGGVAYFLDRELIKNKLDLFISLYDKDAKGTLSVVKDYNPTIHFLALESAKGFEAAKGNPEVEEYLRSVCVQKYYPQIFWDYITCRAESISSSWWDNCLQGTDTDNIKICAQGEEGRSLLKENIGLNRQVKVMFGTTYLLNNREIFGFIKTPAKDELKKIIER